MANFTRFSKTLEKESGKRVVSITVKLTAANCSGKVWFTDLCLQEGNTLTGYHPHTEIFLKKLRDGDNIKPPVWFNGVVRSEETAVLFNCGTTSAPLDIHIYPTADMAGGSIALCQGVGGQKAVFPNDVGKDADLALLAESRSCTKDGIPEKKEGFYQYSAAWDSKHKVTLEDRKSARVLFSMQEMEGYIMPIIPADPEPEPEPTYDETKIAVIRLDKNGSITWDVSYFTSCSDARNFMAENADTAYNMRFGSELALDRIADLTFQNLTNLRHVTLSDKITVLGTGTFQNCSGLISVDAPQVKSIGQYCFQYCTALESISMPDVRSISNQAFIHCEALNNVSIKTLQAPVMSYTFGYCYSLKNIELPTSLAGILAYGFAACQSLTELTLPDGTRYVNENAFQDCKSLTTISLPGSLPSIADNTFRNCSALKTVTIRQPSSLQSIGNSAFSNCSAMEEISLPNSLQTIHIQAFNYSLALETITIAKAEGSISGAPWGATNAQVVWTG